MTKQSKNTGAKGEQAALSFLLGLGYNLVEQNFRCRSGEADLIMVDGPVLVFVEVKTRRNAAFGLPQEAVGRLKQIKVRRIAQHYLQLSHREEQELRFDVAAITFSENGEPVVEHLKGVF